MRELYYHMRRYLAWSAFGIVVFVAPILVVTGGRAPLGPLLVPIGFGGSIFVLLRAVIGVVTGWSPGRADRATAIGIRRFFVGWCAGLLIAFTLDPLGLESRLTPWLPPVLAWMLGGGLALVLADGTIRLRRVWLVLPLAWLGALAAFMIAYFTLTR
jgi:hypothetical protein